MADLPSPITQDEWCRPFFSTLVWLLLYSVGLIGWYMVKSGLEEKEETSYVPRVSPHRLALHLGTAFTLYSVFLWSSLVHLVTPQEIKVTPQHTRLWRLALFSKGLVLLTVVSGAFVAGLKAGLVYNSFPKMADKWIPDDIMAMEPKRKNLTQNPTTVQFIHRILGTGTLTYILGLWFYSRKLPLPPKARHMTNCIAVVGLLQVSLGIAALLLYVPVPVAALHQAGALTLFTTAFWLSYELRMVRKVPKIPVPSPMAPKR